MWFPPDRSNLAFTNCSEAAVIVQADAALTPEPVVFIDCWFYDNYGAALLVTSGYVKVESCTFKRNVGTAIMVAPTNNVAVVSEIKDSVLVDNMAPPE